MEISQRVDRVLAGCLGEGVDWNQHTSLTDPIEHDGLALDSLDIVELIMALEEEFGIEIPDDDLLRTRNPDPRAALSLRPEFDRVRDIVAYIERRLEQKPALAFG